MKYFHLFSGGKLVFGGEILRDPERPKNGFTISGENEIHITTKIGKITWSGDWLLSEKPFGRIADPVLKAPKI